MKIVVESEEDFNAWMAEQPTFGSTMEESSQNVDRPEDTAGDGTPESMQEDSDGEMETENAPEGENAVASVE